MITLAISLCKPMPLICVQYTFLCKVGKYNKLNDVSSPKGNSVPYLLTPNEAPRVGVQGKSLVPGSFLVKAS